MSIVWPIWPCRLTICMRKQLTIAFSNQFVVRTQTMSVINANGTDDFENNLLFIGEHARDLSNSHFFCVCYSYDWHTSAHADTIAFEHGACMRDAITFECLRLNVNERM